MATCNNGHAVSRDAAFCGDCGIALAWGCPNGHQVDAADAYCGTCGQEVQPQGGPPQDESVLLPSPTADTDEVAEPESMVAQESANEIGPTDVRDQSSRAESGPTTDFSGNESPRSTRKWFIALGVGALAAVSIAAIVVALNNSGEVKRAPRAQPRTTSQPSKTAPETTQPPNRGSGATQSSNAASGKILDIDFMNFTHNVRCGEYRDVALANGQWQDAGGPTLGVVERTTVRYLDVTKDGTEDALVEIPCSVGAGTTTNNVLIYAMEGGKPVKVGHLFGLKPSLDRPQRGPALWDSFSAPTDPRCCPSQYVRTVYVYDGRTFVEVAQTLHKPSDYDYAPVSGGLRSDQPDCSEIAVRNAVDVIMNKDASFSPGVTQYSDFGCAQGYAIIYATRGDTEGIGFLFRREDAGWQLLNTEYSRGLFQCDYNKFGIPKQTWLDMGLRFVQTIDVSTCSP